jgi:hypothetical protein
VISEFAFQSVEQRSAEPNRTGDETRPRSAAGNRRVLTSSRRLITRLVALIPGALDWATETSLAFHTTAHRRARVERFQQEKFR